ncbi:ribbon-helix-helix protein, CopG family [Peteryoungia desertarenae]|uniref:Ribbon-helix-helix protein, CopG family n=1 Tax=Peteryoungia desertarenae TaxID=1813451 RepID=A0ABX6QRX1_9HYPH|nr:ribbon-helix-helix protein, CopG family [Peteryoungia desertarenae]QLF71359.1 ribbon-helix-helix protein, CopG family [Peteryoungia desertarenae]
MRLPKDMLSDIEAIAAICDRSRSWVFVRALKSYLATEGKEILEIAAARQAMENGEGEDLDDVIKAVDLIVRDSAA